VAGDTRAASLPPTRHALSQRLRRPPRATVRAWLSARDHDPLQKGENRTRLSGSTDAQPSVLAPRVRDPEEVPRESRSVRVLLGRVRGQPCTESVRRWPSATNMGHRLHASDATCIEKIPNILTRHDGRPLPTWGADACCSEDRARLRRGLLRLQRFQDGPRRHRQTGHTDPDSVGDRIGDSGQRRNDRHLAHAA